MSYEIKILLAGLFTEPPTIASVRRAARTARLIEGVREQLRRGPGRHVIAVATAARADELRQHFTAAELERIDFDVAEKEKGPPAPKG